MKVTREKQEGNQIHLEIEVDGKGIASEYNNAISYLSRDLKVQGFRKGKIPSHIAEKYLDTQRVSQEIFQRYMSESYQEALAKEGIESIAEPHVSAVQAEIGKPFIYKAVVEIRPEVTLGEYKGLSVQALGQEELDEKKMEEQLNQLRRQHAVMIPVDERPAQLGDLVTMAIEGSIEGESIDLGESKDMTMELKEDSFVKGFSDNIVGMNVDEKKEFDLTFPEDYHVEDLRDKEIHFSVHVQEIKEVELPELDDEFAQTVGNEFESLDQLKEKMTEELKELLEDQFEIQKQQRVLDKVVSGASVEIPESMLNRELQAMWQMSEGQQLMNAKVNQDTLRASLIHFMQRADMRETASQRIKTTLVLGQIAQAEEIVVTDEEVQEEIQTMAETHDVSPEQIKAQLEQENRMVALMDELLSFKIIDWVMENNEVEIVDELPEEEVVETAPAEEASESSEEATEEEKVEQSV